MALCGILSTPFPISVPHLSVLELISHIYAAYGATHPVYHEASPPAHVQQESSVAGWIPVRRNRFLVVSTLVQAVPHCWRTNRIPFQQSCTSLPVCPDRLADTWCVMSSPTPLPDHSREKQMVLNPQTHQSLFAQWPLSSVHIRTSESQFPNLCAFYLLSSSPWQQSCHAPLHASGTITLVIPAF